MEVPTDEQTGRPIFLTQGSKWLVWYFGSDGSRYEFQTEVVEKRNENIPLVFIQIPEKSQFTRTQRRNFVRVDVNVEVAVKVEDNVRSYHFLAFTRDLSGGGLAITCPDTYRLAPGDRVRMWMVLPTRSGSVEHVTAAGECTRVHKPDPDKSLQWVSIKFVEISENDRAKIIRTCFERQLELHKVLPETDQKEQSG